MRAPAQSEPRWRRPRRKTAGAPRATATAWTASSSDGSGHTHQSGANAATIGSKCAPRREICRPWRSVTSRGWPCGGRPHGLDEVPDVESACPERAMLEHGERRVSGRERACREPHERSRAEPAHASCALEDRPPDPAEHGLARTLLVGRPARVPDACRERLVCGKAPHGVRQSRGVTGRDEEGVDAVGQQLACARRVRGDERATARERLERLVRDHPPGLLARAEDPERAAGALVERGEVLVLDPAQPLDVRRRRGQLVRELAVSDHPERDLRCEPGGLEDGVEPVERDQLSDEERMKRLGRLPARVEQAIFRTDERDVDLAGRQAEGLAEEAGVRGGVCDHDVGAAEGDAVDLADDHRTARACPKPAPVADERVV